MGFKTITIKDEAYDRINSAKLEGESFSELFIRKFPEPKPDIMKFAGIWKDMTDEEFKELKARMKTYRNSFNNNAERRRKDVLSRLRSSD